MVIMLVGATLLTASCASSDDLTLDDLREVEAERDEAIGRATQLDARLEAADAELSALAPRPTLQDPPAIEGGDDSIRVQLLQEAVLDCSQVAAQVPDYEPDLRTEAELWNHCLASLNDLVTNISLRSLTDPIFCPITDEFDALDLFTAQAFRLQLLNVVLGKEISVDAAADLVAGWCTLAYGR